MGKYVCAWLIAMGITGGTQAAPAFANTGPGSITTLSEQRAPGAGVPLDMRPEASITPPAGAVAAVLPPSAEVDEPPGPLLMLLGAAILILWMRRWPPTR